MGHKKGHDDERDLMSRIHKVVAVVQPEVFVFENVPGLVSKRNQPYLTEILSRLQHPYRESSVRSETKRDERIQYDVECIVLLAANFGVPQLRRRLFIIGVRKRDEYRGKLQSIIDVLRSPPVTNARDYKTVRQAIGHMPDPGGWKRWTWKIPVQLQSRQAK
jgi:DNA (cytosine-5)-methyltransferase 1